MPRSLLAYGNISPPASREIKQQKRTGANNTEVVPRNRFLGSMSEFPDNRVTNGKRDNDRRNLTTFEQLRDVAEKLGMRVEDVEVAHRELRELRVRIERIDDTATEGMHICKENQRIVDRCRQEVNVNSDDLDEVIRFMKNKKASDSQLRQDLNNLKAQVVNGKQALRQMARDQKKPIVVPGIAEKTYMEEITALKKEIAELKSRAPEVDDGAATFTSLLADWMKSSPAKEEPQLEEGELSEAVGALPGNLLIKVVMGGILKMHRDHGEFKTLVRGELSSIKSSLQRFGLDVGQNAPNENYAPTIKMQLMRLRKSVTDIDAKYTKYLALQATEKAALDEKVGTFVRIVRDLARNGGGGVQDIENEETRLQAERVELHEWTSRYLNALNAGPKSSGFQQIDKYDRNLMTMEQMIMQETASLSVGRQMSLLANVEHIKRVADLTRDTLNSIAERESDTGKRMETRGARVVTDARDRPIVKLPLRTDAVPVTGSKRSLIQSNYNGLTGNKDVNMSDAKRSRQSNIGHGGEGLPY